MEKALAVTTQRKGKKIVTLMRRVFLVTNRSFQTCTENEDHGAKVMRNNSNTTSTAVEMSVVR